jgi:hypothetical protein
LQAAQFAQSPVGAALEIALVAEQAIEPARDSFVEERRGEPVQVIDDSALEPEGTDEIVEGLVFEEAAGLEFGEPRLFILEVVGVGQHHRVFIVRQGAKFPGRFRPVSRPCRQLDVSVSSGGYREKQV